jgi:hypothetical protein
MMRPLRLRRLTDGERTMVAEVFGQALDPRPVRVLAAPLLKRAFVAMGPLVVWPVRSAWADFSLAPLADRAVFVHELTHVWQAQNGVNLLFAKLQCGDHPQAYVYRLDPTTRFETLNIEQQAMAVEHAYLCRQGAAAPYPAEAYAALLPAWASA